MAASPSVFRELDRVASELRHERKLRESAIESSRRYFRERECLVVQIRNARLQAVAAAAGDASPKSTARELQVLLTASLEALDSASLSETPRMREAEHTVAKKIDEQGLCNNALETSTNNKPVEVQNGSFEQGNKQAIESTRVSSMSEDDICSDIALHVVVDGPGSGLVDEGEIVKTPPCFAERKHTNEEVVTPVTTIEDIQDVHLQLSTPRSRKIWEPDSAACNLCNVAFSIAPPYRRHHCRQCGQCVCEKCSPFRVHLESPVRRPRNLPRVLAQNFLSSFISGPVAIETTPPADVVDAHRVCMKCHGLDV